MPGDLELATTQEIIDELGKRFDCYIFSGITSHTEHQDMSERYYGGHLIMCLGMTTRLQCDIVADIEEMSDPPLE